MFKSVITTTPLTTDVANGYFENKITGQSWNRDYSFLATLRALLEPRMGDGDSLSLIFGDSSYDEYSLNQTDIGRAIRIITNEYYNYDGILYIHNFTNPSPAANTAWMEMIKSSFEQRCPGWHLVEKVSTFFRKVFRVLCFINPDKKSTMVFTENMSIREMHYLQCGIFPFMPWYFNQEAGVSEIEMELTKSLREKTSEKYEDCIARIAEKYDFKTARIRQLLAGFESRYERIQCDNVRNQIERANAELDALQERIGDWLKEKRDYEIKLLGLETKIAQSDGDSEIMEYFLCNKHVSLESVSDSTMRFVVCDYLTYFDEDMAKRIIDNQTSYVYRPNGRACNNIIPAEDMKMLMEAIFIDEKLRIRFCAAYEFQLEGSTRALGGYHYSSDYREYMPNTHIDRYRCLGSYGSAMNRCLRDHNYIGAIEQCIASCKSLNFGDSAVMQEFMRVLYGISDYGTNNRCIELPDGSVVKPKEAIEYLKKEAEEANG